MGSELEPMLTGRGFGVGWWWPGGGRDAEHGGSGTYLEVELTAPGDGLAGGVNEELPGDG